MSKKALNTDNLVKSMKNKKIKTANVSFLKKCLVNAPSSKDTNCWVYSNDLSWLNSNEKSQGIF